tara:strand:- start:1968 stop:2408 length:441 start_codon:yes stop_codon:yes gene_type:complete
MHRLSKKFRFETAHRLGKGYAGKCKNIHGHSWNGQIYIDCEQLDEYDFGMDFGVIAEFTKAVEAALDHGIMLHDADTELIELCKKNDWLNVVLPANPTCEIIAAWIFNQAELHFQKYPGIGVYCVSIEETCTSRCEYYGPNKTALS